MDKGKQIDKVSKDLLGLSQSEKKEAKREHKRAMRHQRKDIFRPSPQHNRYDGYIG